MKRFATASLAVLGLVVFGFVSSAQAADTATGTWTWEFKRPNTDQVITTTLKLTQDGEKLTGTISRPNNTETAIEEGSVKNGEVVFSVTREFNGNKFVQKYKGTLKGDAITGKVEFERNGEAQSRDWTAKRS
ncbi:MAG: hypothetical protein P4L84_16340 [Isosphaeraceae bacterium]|nr:hypothetical protein [Isosphaeraceae bacterium]